MNIDNLLIFFIQSHLLLFAKSRGILREHLRCNIYPVFMFLLIYAFIGSVSQDNFDKHRKGELMRLYRIRGNGAKFYEPACDSLSLFQLTWMPY